MQKILSLTALSLLLSFAVLTPAQAAKPLSSSAKSGSTPVGNDISYPQCGSTLPTGHAFGIVGVNGGTAAKTNPCLAEQLTWANAATGGTSQPKAQLYVNTANPGEVIDQITTWPTNNTDETGYTPNNPYGLCSGANDAACSWQYGWNRAVEAVNDRFLPAATAAAVDTNPASYVWWLDVETGNTWQSGSPEALARNAASLEGMAAHYNYRGAKVGVYSTNSQWGQIVGSSVTSASNLYGLDNWQAGALTLRGAKSNCANTPFTPTAKVTITQYVSAGLDYDYSCL